MHETRSTAISSAEGASCKLQGWRLLEARGAIYMWSTDAEQEAALRIGDSLRELQEDDDEYHEISGFDLSEISFAESPINVFNYIGYRNGANIVKY